MKRIILQNSLQLKMTKKKKKKFLLFYNSLQGSLMHLEARLDSDGQETNPEQSTEFVFQSFKPASCFWKSWIYPISSQKLTFVFFRGVSASGQCLGEV